jgi:hypothetical protein
MEKALSTGFQRRKEEECERILLSPSRPLSCNSDFDLDIRQLVSRK